MPQAIVQLSTGGRSRAGRERGGMLSLRPEMASLSVGSNNFPTRVYENSPDLVDWLASEMKTYGIKPEIEAFDLSHIHQAVEMAKYGRLPSPLYVQFVMGVKNAMPVDRAVFDFYIATLKRLALDAEWCGASIGPNQITFNECCVAAGGHARTGLEYNLRLDRSTLAPSNAALVRRVVELCDRRDRPVAALAQARALLGLPAMAISPFDSALVGPLLGDAEIAATFTDAAEIDAMIRVERALVRAEAACGVIPAQAGAAIGEGLRGAVIEPAVLAAGTASAGVPVPALVAAWRARLSPEAGQRLHWGATSQDTVDTGPALRLCPVLDLFEVRVEALARTLAAPARRGASQGGADAQPGGGAHWLRPPGRPLAAAAVGAGAADLARLRPRLLRAQPGGAVGSNAKLAPNGPAVAAAMAAELGLEAGPAWHTDRSGLAVLAAWCAGLTGALGKMAGDLVLMGCGESGEARAGTGGESSTMPQKANPVSAETIGALARLAASLAAPMHLARLHGEERDGTAWTLEWLVLPQIVAAAGAALGHAQGLAETLAPDPARMRAVPDLDGGAAMAEAASFRLAAHMPRSEAKALVKRLVRELAVIGETLAEARSRLGPAPIALDPAEAMGGVREAIEALLAEQAATGLDLPGEAGAEARPSAGGVFTRENAGKRL